MGARCGRCRSHYDRSVSAPSAPALRLEHVSFAYAGRQALDDVSLSVGTGRFAALLGENGAGKTTLFSLVTGLLETRQGAISICGTDVANGGWRTHASLGVVFQQPTLDLDLSVQQNLRYFSGLHGLSRAEAAQRIERELTRFGMEERAREKVRNLNGGHRRRVEIARALLHNPKVLLLDEPTVGLDVPARKAIVDHVHGLAARGIAILWATHLIDEIRPEDDVIVLHKGGVAASGETGAVIRDQGCATLDEAFTALTRSKESAAAA
jgi:ABC-2 type transport system ATP-binding protein